MMKLNDTIKMMNSEDYKERFKAEYLQTKIRYDKLHKMLIKYEAKTLNFKPICNIELLKEQIKNMGNYLYCLEVRAEIEGISLDNLEEQSLIKDYVKPFDYNKLATTITCSNEVGKSDNHNI